MKNYDFYSMLNNGRVYVVYHNIVLEPQSISNWLDFIPIEFFFCKENKS